MPEIWGVDKLLSVIPRKRLGLWRLFGTSQFGHSNYGLDEIYYNRTGCGKARLGIDSFGDIIIFSGLYNIYHANGKTKFYRDSFYIPDNPRTLTQQTNRAKMTAAVLAWKALTDDEKLFYNKRAFGKRMSGYNLFLKKYLLSH